MNVGFLPILIDFFPFILVFGFFKRFYLFERTQVGRVAGRRGTGRSRLATEQGD